MKTNRDISMTPKGTLKTSGSITDPDIAARPTTATPVSIPVNAKSENNLPDMDLAAPREWTRAARGTIRPNLGGDPMPGIDMEGAPSSDPRYNSTAREYTPPPSNLPMQVSASEILKQNLDPSRGSYNMAPGNRSPLAGTVNDLSTLRRRAGGE